MIATRRGCGRRSTGLMPSATTRSSLAPGLNEVGRKEDKPASHPAVCSLQLTDR
jgi:hypothetical protein